MKVGDTFRIGGIPIVVVADSDYPHSTTCRVCAFNMECVLEGSRAVSNIEVWLGGNCLTGEHHYEVRT